MVIELDGSVGESSALFSGSASTVQCSAESAIDRKVVSKYRHCTMSAHRLR